MVVVFLGQYWKSSREKIKGCVDMDMMYEYFYLTMLIGAILSGIISFVTAIIGKRPSKFWRMIMYGLLTVAVVGLIGFAVTLPWGR